MIFRLGTKEDIPLMCQLRKKQLVDEGIGPCIDIDDELLRFFEDKIGDNSLVEWLIEEDGEVVATAAIQFVELPPTFTNRTGVRGYVTNMYTAPAYRKKGYATMLLGKLMDESRKRGVFRIWLGASVYGRPVYKRFGFVDADTHMELNLDM